MDVVERIDTGRTLGIVVDRGAAHIHNHLGADIAHLRIDMGTEVVDTLVLQTHTIEHARRRLGHTRIGVAVAGMEGGTLHDDAAKLMKRNQVGKLKTIAESARSGHYGVLEM